MNSSDQTVHPFTGMVTKTKERQLVRRLQQSLKEEESDIGGRIFAETTFQISDAIGWLRRTDLRTAELRVNLYGLGRALHMGKKWGDRVDDLLFFYVLAFVHLSRTAFAGTCGSYAEGLAVCAYALRTERDRSTVIPIPMMLRQSVPPKRTEILADAVYCEAEALRQTDLGKTENERVEELQRWASMPEVVYSKGGIPHMAALYIADELEKLRQNSTGALDKYPLLRAAGCVSSKEEVRLLWMRAALSDPGSFYEKISLRIMGSDPEYGNSPEHGSNPEHGDDPEPVRAGALIDAAAESGTAEEFLQAAVHYAVMCGEPRSRISGENRIAVERIADGIRRLLDENGHEPRSGAIHSLGFL